jgi:hypothetical protein
VFCLFFNSILILPLLLLVIIFLRLQSTFCTADYALVQVLLKDTRVYPKVSGLATSSKNLQMVQLSATRCSYIAMMRVSLVSFAATTLCVTSQRVIPKVSLYFVT